MFRKVCSHILAVSCVLAFAACADEVAVNPEGVTLNLEIADVSAGVTTRAVPAGLPKPVQEQFRLAIVNEQGRTVYDDAFAPSVGPFAPGRFTLSVNYGTDELALDAPCYAGEATASVYKGLQNNVRIDARVANALMSIAYQADGLPLLDDAFESYGVTFTLDGRSVSLDGPEPSQSAYFPAGSVPAVTFHAVHHDGRAVSTSLDALLADKLPLEAGRHARVTLGVDEDRVQITKVDIEEVTISETIPAAWLPRPKTAAAGFGADGTLHNVETNPVGEAKVDFTTSSALQDMELTLDIQDPGYSYLTGTYLLSEMSDAQIKTLRTAGIGLPATGAEAGSIDLSRFATNLQSDKGATTTNTLSLRVKANDRWDTDTPQTYSIVVERPEFGVRVLPGNIWTREFTISALRAEDVSKGNFDVLNKRINYQVQQNGVWTTLNERTAKNLTPATAYTIRACYRGCVYSDPLTVTTFPTTPLTNGSLDQWNNDGGTDYETFYLFGRGGHGVRFSFPGWATLNEVTSGPNYSSAGYNYVYTSRSGTRPTGQNRTSYLPSGYTDDAVSGTAVWVATIGWGINSTLGSSGNFGRYKTPGVLFLGSVTDIDVGKSGVNSEKCVYTKNDGIAYDSHPTGLIFYYKYAGVTGDQALAEIGVYHDDVLLGECKSKYGSQVNYREVQLDIVYDESEEKLSLTPNRLVVEFASGESTELNFVRTSGTSGVPTCGYLTGSQLWLDDISLVYDK